MRLLNALHRRALFIILITTCISVSLYYTYATPGDRLSPRFPLWKPGEEGETHDALPVSDTSGSNSVADSQVWLSSHNLSFPLRYSFRKIVTRKSRNAQRVSTTKVNATLFPEPKTADSPAHTNSHSTEPLILDVPHFEAGPPKAPNLIFGIQTTLQRLKNSAPQLSRWLAHTSAKLCVVLIEAEKVPVNTTHMESLQSHMRAQGFDISLFAAGESDTFPQRYFSLVKIMYEHRTPSTQWLSLIDDDTFFPSLPALTNMLAQYPSSEQHYIGALSEDWWAVAHYGLMAFGGAGIFLSLPLAEALQPYHANCSSDPRSSAGDITLMDCIYTYTTTKLKHVPDLHQADMQGDLSGFYESGRRHLSLHHWKEGSVFGTGLPMDAMHLVSDVCGECFLQRWQFGNDLILTNGYSIAEYPKGHVEKGHENEVDMEKLEETWNRNIDVKHSLGPTRPRLELQSEKVQYGFLDARVEGEGVRQVYLHRGVEGAMDTVVELLWTGEGEV